MKNQPNKTTVKDGLPTAEETLKRHVPPALYERGDCYVGHALDAIESHTAAHTAALEDRIKELENSRNDFENAAYKSTMDLKRLVAKYDGLSRRFKELEAENTRYRDRIGEALKFLLSRQQTTPGLGAPVTILKQALEK